MVEVGWYSYREPGGQLNRHWSNRCQRLAGEGQSERPEGRGGKTRSVEQQVFDRYRLLTLAAETRHDIHHPFIERQAGLLEQQPDSGRRDRLGGREDAEQTVVPGRAEIFNQGQLAVTGQRDLHRRQQAFVHFPSDPLQQGVHSRPIEPRGFDSSDLLPAHNHLRYRYSRSLPIIATACNLGTFRIGFRSANDAS